EQSSCRRALAHRNSVLERAPSLGDVTPDRPKAPEGGGETKQQVAAFCVPGPLDRGPQIRVLELELREQARLPTSPRLEVDALRHREEVGGVSPTRLGETARF